MTKEKKDNRRGHWMKPLNGKWRPAHHLLIWIEEETKGRHVTAKRVDTSHIYYDAAKERHIENWPLGEGKDLDFTIDRAAAGKGTLTVWIPGGWDHLVLSGLADMMDQGIITWRYASIEAHRVLIRGQWRGKEIIITSVANWTGSTWDAWRDKVKLRGRELFTGTFGAISAISQLLPVGSVAPSAGAAGLLLWRSALGPKVGVMVDAPKKGESKKPSRRVNYIAPLPSRPVKCRHAERHCAYGLVHRQMREGLVDETIYCVDLREAYLVGLASMLIPVSYTKTLHQPKIAELNESLCSHTACALVHIDCREAGYPVRQKGRTAWASGEFWTWLAGIELAEALCLSHVKECKTAYIWADTRMPDTVVAPLLAFGEQLQEKFGPLTAACWRSIYSQMVGRFAAKRKRWVEAPAHHNFGRWASWHGIDAATGQTIAYRSIAGHTQRLSAQEDAGDSVTMFFSCLTAAVRRFINMLARLAGTPNVIAIEADAIWVNRAGWQALLKRCSEVGVAPDRLRTKETFRRAWLTGKTIAVVEMDGKQYLRCPGVPADIAVGEQGDVRWPQGDDWHAEGGPDMRRGVRRHERRYSAAEIVRVFSHPARTLPFTEEIIDPALSEFLLQPLNGPERSVLDE